MECNKEEAIRAKEIAERKLTEKDFAGAKKFALKAHSLYSQIEGIQQVLATIEVYIASENKINGEMNWYAILGVTPSANDEAMRKQFRKLALILHPDKNKSAGADGAFKLLSDAWSLLSDKPKRFAYDQKRSMKGPNQNNLKKCGAAAPPPNANGFHNVPKRTTYANVAKTTTRVQPPPAPRPHPQAPRPQPRNDTFWTICRKCKMHYEYLIVYLNHTLLCPNCHDPFLASETSAPVNFPKPSSSSAQQRKQNPSHHVINGVNSEKGSSSSVQFNTEKRKREQEVTPGGGNLLKMARGPNNNVSSGIGTHNEPKIMRDFMQLDKRVLWEKSQADIRKKLVEWHLEDVAKAAEAREKQMQKEREKQEKEMQKEREKQEKQMQKEREKEKKEKKYGEGNTSGVYKNEAPSSSSAVPDDKEQVVIEPEVMNVPDPDFYDFDQDRTEKSFQENQVWASYDDDDGMPRLYAMVHKVISISPFKVEISWLNSKGNSEFGPLEWVQIGFRKTCGEFRSGKHEVNNSLNSFSHKVDWKSGPRGTVCFYPKRGDVWALYRNWARDWNGHTPDEIIHKYDMVEVLADYNEKEGVVYVTPLIKVCGFKTVFRTQADPDNIRKIPRKEMFRFSHKVPSHKLIGSEGPNVPIGCVELDPASTPLELLQIIEEEKEEIGRKEEPMLKYSRKEQKGRKEEPMLKYSRKKRHNR